MLTVVIVLIAVNIAGYLTVYLLLREKVRKSASPAAQAAELRDEVSRLVVELNQTTDRNVALLEDRVAALTDLLAKADKKIGLLQRELDKHDVSVKVYSRVAEPRPPAAAPAAAAPAEAVGALRPASPGLVMAPAQAAAQGRPQQEGAASPGGRGRDGAAQEDMHQMVLSLHRAGISSALIASRVGAPKGEVDLIISLAQRKGLS